MDQLRVFLRQLLKYHFWVLAVLLLAAGVTVWAIASADMQERYDKRKRELDNEFSTLQRVRGTPDFPNLKVIQEIKNSHDRLKKKVFDAAQFLYRAQENKNPWPDVLGREFLDFVNHHPQDAAIPPDYLDIYSNFISRYFPDVFRQVNVRHPIAGSGPPPGTVPAPGADAPPVKYEGVVDWSEGSRKALEAAYHWSNRPTTLQVRLAQEDLWVYEALLRIIKDINAGATEHYNAYVKRIDTIEIGPQAAASWLASEAYNTHFGKVDDSAQAAAGAAPSEAAAAGGDPLERQLLNFRYLDDKGKPLPFGTPNPYPEFKMMPIHMKLLIDQSRIPNLLVNGANSNMPIEFKVVRLRPEAGKNFVVNPGGEEGGGGEPGSTGLPSGIPERPAGDATKAVKDDEADPLNVAVELYGIIYIFNPPDKARLQPEAEAVASTPSRGAGAARATSGTAAAPAAAGGNPAKTPSGTAPAR